MTFSSAVGVEDGVVGAEQDRLERDGRALVVGQALDEQGLTLLDAVLLAAGLHDRVHGSGHSERVGFGLGSRTAPSASAATAPRLRFYGIARPLVAVDGAAASRPAARPWRPRCGPASSMRTRRLLPDERAAAGDRDDVAVDLRHRVVDVVHVRLDDVDEHLVAGAERHRALLDLVGRALHDDVEVVQRQALGALEEEQLAGLGLEPCSTRAPSPVNCALTRGFICTRNASSRAWRLGREVAQLALELDRDRLLGLDHALAVAGRARPAS